MIKISEITLLIFLLDDQHRLYKAYVTACFMVNKLSLIRYKMIFLGCTRKMFYYLINYVIQLHRGFETRPFVGRCVHETKPLATT